MLRQCFTKGTRAINQVQGLTGLAAAGLSSLASQDKILLQGLVFYGYHGALQEEQTLGQNFIVDATLTADLKAAGISDKLEDTVNYALVYNEIKQILEGRPSVLLENVAEKIAARILENHKLVNTVSIRIKKPHVAVGGSLDFLGIEITRSR